MKWAIICRRTMIGMLMIQRTTRIPTIMAMLRRQRTGGRLWPMATIVRAAREFNYWSNPGVTYGGVPMGVAEGTSTFCSQGVSAPNCDADNHETLNNTAYTVANFRQSATSICPSCTGGAVVLNGDTFPSGVPCECAGTTISLLNVTVPDGAIANLTAETSNYHRLRNNP